MKRFLSFLLVSLTMLTAAAYAQRVYWEPGAPRIGDPVTFYYDTRYAEGLDPSVSQIWMHWGIFDPETENWSTPPEGIWPPGSHLHTDSIALQSPMTEGADSVWQLDVNFDTTVAAIAFVFTDGGSNWDNNNGVDWVLLFVEPGIPCWWTPEEPEPGDAVTIYYDAVPGTLPNNPTTVILHWGVNEVGHGNWQLPPEETWPPGSVAQGVAVQSPLTNIDASVWEITIQTNDEIATLHFVFTDGSNWDNNSDANWDIYLSEPPVPVYTHRVFRYDPRSAFASYLSSNINTLNLSGTFNGWSMTATPLTDVDPYGNFGGEVEVPVGALEYKFVINGGTWMADPDNPLSAGGEYNNSYLELAVDSLPQVYDVQPGENIVFEAGTSVGLTMKVRPGDLGPGLDDEPSVLVNGNSWGSSWDAGTSTLTLDPLPSDAGYVKVAVTAVDSAGRSGTRMLGYGFRDEGYVAVDAAEDWAYQVTDPGYDLLGINIRERAEGDSVQLVVYLNDINADDAAILITVASTIDGWAGIPGLEAEVEVPDLSAGGVSLLLLEPSSPHFDADIHNRLHSSGDLSDPGAEVDLTVDANNDAYSVVVATEDLESVLGSFQSAWNFTCATLMAAGEESGYCGEVTAGMGGVEGIEEPDVIDALFYFAADVERKLMINYGGSRRVTFDAPGRGVAEVDPEDIGPNMLSPGPLCRVLTRGAPTIDTTRNVSGRVTSAAAIEQVWLVQNGNWMPVALVEDTFTVPVTLEEGPNVFTVRAVDVAGDSGRSPAMTYTLVINHAPDIQITTRQEGQQGALDASATTDPEDQTVAFEWSADPDNPEAVTLEDANTAVARFTFPDTPGEYYFNLTAADPDEHASHARTLFTIAPGSIDGFSNDEAVEWVQNAVIYEIYPRSFSATGDLAGITAGIPRIAGLGVNCIWLMPIFEGPSSHGYEITDYYTIEQDYGTEQDLRDLVEAAHASGIRVILDMVLNHTGIGHPFMQDALRHGRHSHYWDYYDRDASGNYTYYYDWSSLPNLNLDNPDAVRYFIDMCKYWVEEFDVDGYRCDVAWGPHQRSPQFWVQWRQELKEIKPECLLLAEAAASDHSILIDRFDLAFDWNLHHEGGAGLTNWFPAVPSFPAVTQLIDNYGYWWPPYKNPLRFLENHDEDRFISLNTADQTKLASSFLMSIPGAVMLYAGQEVGTHSQRGQINWNLDPDNMYPHYYRLTNARTLVPSLFKGDFLFITNNVSASCYSFARIGDGMDPAVWVGNFSSSPQIVRVYMEQEEMGIEPDSTYTVSELLGDSYFTIQGENLTSILVSLNAYESKLWVISDSVISVDAPESRPSLPQTIKLHPAYPNPFNPTTTLPVELSVATRVTLKIYDILGREVETVVDDVMPAGFHRVTWNGTSHGQPVTTGVYFAVMDTEQSRQIRKLVLLK